MSNYKSKYTGAEIDDAVGRVKDGDLDALMSLYALEPNKSISAITVGYTDSFHPRFFNRRPKVGDLFFCIGRTRVDNIAFSMTAKITGWTDGDDPNAIFEAVEIVPITHAQHATSAEHSSTADSATNADHATSSDTAKKATQDENGENIPSTYARKDALAIHIQSANATPTGATTLRLLEDPTQPVFLCQMPEGKTLSDIALVNLGGLVNGSACCSPADTAVRTIDGRSERDYGFAITAVGLNGAEITSGSIRLCEENSSLYAYRRSVSRARITTTEVAVTSFSDTEVLYVPWIDIVFL